MPAGLRISEKMAQPTRTEASNIPLGLVFRAACTSHENAIRRAFLRAQGATLRLSDFSVIADKDEVMGSRVFFDLKVLQAELILKPSTDVPASVRRPPGFIRL